MSVVGLIVLRCFSGMLKFYCKFLINFKSRVLVFFKKIMFIYFWERESTQVEQGQRERGTEDPKQALCWQQQAWCRAWTRELHDHDLSWSSTLNRLSHPGAPNIFLNLGNQQSPICRSCQSLWSKYSCPSQFRNTSLMSPHELGRDTQ